MKTTFSGVPFSRKPWWSCFAWMDHWKYSWVLAGKDVMLCLILDTDNFSYPLLSLFPLSHSGNPACMSQIFLSQPASQTAKKSWWRETESGMNCHSLQSIPVLRLPWKWVITGWDSLLKQGWWIGTCTVTIKIATLLRDQIRFFWTAMGCNHLVMPACLLFGA